MNGTPSWFGRDWIENDARALGVYIALLILRFWVRFGTEIPVLCKDEVVMEMKLKPYLSIFLNDEEEQAEAIAAGKKFLKAFGDHTSVEDCDEVLDVIELDYYDILKEAYLRHVNIAEPAVKTSDYDAALPGIRTFLSDLASNKFAKGKITSAGSSILLTPFGDFLDLYSLSEEDVRRFMDVLRISGIMFLDIIPAPVLDLEF